MSSTNFKNMPSDGYDDFKNYSLLKEDFMLPTALIKEGELKHNRQWMQTYSEKAGVSLCPHGKTTMIPYLFNTQLEQGAWGITLATSYQVEVAIQNGVKRILLANQLIGKQNTLNVLNNLNKNRDIDFYCLVDHNSNVDQLSYYLKQYKGLNIKVLIEVSINNGRAGVRNSNSAVNLARYIKNTPQIQLVGIECFEGIISGKEAQSNVSTFLNELADIAKVLDQQDLFEAEEVILSAGGSAYYDLVCEVFNKVNLSQKTRVVIRPGCYLSHDSQLYKTLQNNIKSRDKIASCISGNLEPALEVMAYVQSLPEPNLAIIGMGKRDVSFDAGLPIPTALFSKEKRKLIKLQCCELININDQHAYLKYDEAYQPSIGDIVIFGISHPCLTFDKWKYIPLVDKDYKVVRLLETFF